jgi:hypothetical protein
MKNADFWDIETQFVLHRRHITIPLQFCRLTLRNISGFHDDDYEECGLLGCYTMWLVRTEVSEEHRASIIRVTRIGELGTTLAVTSNRRTLMGALCSSETSVLTRATLRNIPEDGILQMNVWITGCLDTIFRNSKYYAKTWWKLDQFQTSSEGKEKPALLGPLERAQLNHWTSDCAELILRDQIEYVFTTILNPVTFEVVRAVTIKNALLWDDTLWESFKKWRFGGTSPWFRRYDCTKRRFLQEPSGVSFCKTAFSWISTMIH